MQLLSEEDAPGGVRSAARIPSGRSSVRGTIARDVVVVVAVVDADFRPVVVVIIAVIDVDVYPR